MDAGNESLMYSYFLEWFEGKWDNQQQAYSNPRGQSNVIVNHEKVGPGEFRCTYRYKRSVHPYRDYTIKVLNNDGNVLVQNGDITLTWKLESGIFVCKNCVWRDDVLYDTEAYLGEKFYVIADRGLRDGHDLLWGLPKGEFYNFNKQS